MKKISLLAIITFCMQSICVHAQWPTSTTVNVRMCTDANSQTEATICRDGKGGAIVVWTDNRNGFSNNDIYAQRVDTNGVVKWAGGGVIICSSANNQLYPVITSDGNGGAIIAWYDQRITGNDDIYAQKIDSTGAVQWTADGIVVCGAVNHQRQPQIISDSSGGAIIIWDDSRYAGSGVPYTVFAQKINSSGVPQWTADGIEVNTQNTGGGVSLSSLVSDGSGGAFISVQTVVSSTSIYMQRITSTGTVWSTNGTLVDNSSTYILQHPKIASDGAGGAFISYLGHGIQLNRVNGTGQLLWTVPVSISDTTGTVADAGQQIIASGTGNAILIWEKGPSGARDVYGQKINSSGSKQWGIWGTALASSATDEAEPYAVPTAAGGAVVTYINSNTSAFTQYVYAQGIDNSGTLLWGSGGTPVSTASYCAFSGFQSYMHPVIVPVGTGDAIVTWQDSRNGSNSNYTQKIFAYAAATGIENLENQNSIAVYPNPFITQTIFQSNKVFQDATLMVYNSFGQLVKQIKNISGQTIVLQRDNLPGGLYFICISEDNKIFTTDKLIITDN